MIFKVKKDCFLYQYLNEELENNYIFNDRIKKYCQIYQCTRRDLDIQVVIKKKKPLLIIKYRDGRKIEDYDFSGIVIEDLAITPREYHKTNINKYVTDDVKKKLVKPLYYHYFWIVKDLYVEIADTGFPISFRMNGIVNISKEEEQAINNIIDIVEDYL